LSEGIRKANAKKATIIRVNGRDTWGYQISLDDLPIATENVFTNYVDDEPAVVEFIISNGNKLNIIFPHVNRCCMVCETKGRQIKTPTDFKKAYGVSVGFVPVLGPVEHDEPLFKKDAARLALLTHRASRNFRNIWHHYPEGFDDFRELIKSSWPGMDIHKPEVILRPDKQYLNMFCPEERILREIFWAGFGFQVWCQMLTFLVKAKNETVIVIDEPDIYLHSDLQRQLLHILKTIGPDIIMATHSTEIISEADRDDLLIINKKNTSAKRIKNPSQVVGVFEVLGSNLNPTLTQLAKTRKVVFVEGKDFIMLSQFARKLGRNQIANRSDFAVIPVEGYNPKRVNEFAKGMEFTLGTAIKKAVIFDRDYRSESEIIDVKKELSEYCSVAWVHNRKEVENYLFECAPLERAIVKRIDDYNIRTGKRISYSDDVNTMLLEITEETKESVRSQYLARRAIVDKIKTPSLDESTIYGNILREFDNKWATLQGRIEIMPGKEVLSAINRYIQEKYKVSVSSNNIIDAFRREEIHEDISDLIELLEEFRKMSLTTG